MTIREIQIFKTASIKRLIIIGLFAIIIEFILGGRPFRRFLNEIGMSIFATHLYYERWILSFIGSIGISLIVVNLILLRKFKFKSLEIFTVDTRGIVILFVVILNAILILRDILFTSYFFTFSLFSTFFFFDLFLLILIGIYIGAPRLSRTSKGTESVYFFVVLFKVVFEFFRLSLIMGSVPFFYYFEFIYLEYWLRIILSLLLLLLTFSVLIPMSKGLMQNRTTIETSFPLKTYPKPQKTDFANSLSTKRAVSNNNICPECKSEISPDSKYCPFCGHQF